MRIFYEMGKGCVWQLQKDKMIAQGEEDIKDGRTYSLKEAKKLVDSWEAQSNQ